MESTKIDSYLTLQDTTGEILTEDDNSGGDRNARLVFTLAIPLTDRAITRVAVTISSLNRRSRLNLVHEDVPSAHARYLHNRWTGILYGLGVTLAMTP